MNRHLRAITLVICLTAANCSYADPYTQDNDPSNFTTPRANFMQVTVAAADTTVQTLFPHFEQALAQHLNAERAMLEFSWTGNLP